MPPRTMHFHRCSMHISTGNAARGVQVRRWQALPCQVWNMHEALVAHAGTPRASNDKMVTRTSCSDHASRLQQWAIP